ncbi:MAG: hypothetical protein K2K05_10170, partial [Muribaculaceae bacterium]|nr:hypothetical protein [Muribaculaceae bacterium]
MLLSISRYFRPIAATLIALSAVGIAMAVPADPRPKKFTQPDGTVITVKIRGDERCHFYLSEDDYLLVERDGAFYYAYADASGTIVESDIKARPAQLRTGAERDFLSRVDMTKVYDALRLRTSEDDILRTPAVVRNLAQGSGDEFKIQNSEFKITRGPGLFEDASFPVIGQQKAIVVLVEYKDVKFNLEDPHDYFSRMLNEEGFSDFNGTGSARDYFIYNSCGQFEPEFDVYGPVTLPR